MQAVIDKVVERVSTYTIIICLAFTAGLLVFTSMKLPKVDFARYNLLASPHFDPVLFVVMVLFVIAVHAIFVAPSHRQAERLKGRSGN